MKKLLSLCLFLVCALVQAQTTSVTATVTDSTSQAWINGTWTLTFVPNPANPNINIYNINGTPLSSSVINQKGTMDSSGALSFTIYKSNSISPYGSSWKLVVCPLANSLCGTYNFSTGSNSSMDLSTALTSILPIPNFPAVAGSYGYNDNEARLTLPVGGTYWNVSLNTQRYWNGSSWSSICLALVNCPTTPVVVTFAQLVAAITACGSNPCTIIIPNELIMTENYVIPSYVNLVFINTGSLSNLTFNLTLNGPIEAAPFQIFIKSSGSITLGPIISKPFFEWFGAIGDSTGAHNNGTDNTTAIQNCLSAITNGQCMLQNLKYRITSTVSITSSNVGIGGVSSSIVSSTIYPTPSSSTIVIDSASADAVDVSGTDTSHNITYNKFTDFTINRAVTPTTPARGLSISFSYGAIIDRVTSQDSLSCFYFHGFGSQGTGYIANSACTWGYNGVSETGLSLAGFQIDSVDTTPNNSIRIRHSFIVNNTGNNIGGLTYGLYVAGAATNDLEADNIETAQLNYGDYVQNTGSGFASSSDMHIIDPVNDACITTCEFISGITGTLELTSGWNYRLSSSSPVIDIESSSHVSVISQQIYYPSGTGVGVYAALSGSIRVIGNDFTVGNNTAVYLNGTPASVVDGNIMNAITATDIIELVSSPNTAVSNNTINGTATNGIYIDSNSINISGIETNPLNNSGLGTITNFINDVAGNGNTVVQNIQNAQTATITPLSSAGSGATAVCQTGFICTPNYGSITLVSGTGPGVGDIVSVSWTIPTNHLMTGVDNAYDITAGAVLGTIIPDEGSVTAKKCVFFAQPALTASHTYNIIYHCF